MATKQPKQPKQPTVKLMCPCEGRETKNVRHETLVQVYICQSCGAIHGTCYLGESYSIAKPYMCNRPDMDDTTYFDLECLGSNGITRRHGWVRNSTKLIAQVG